MSKDEMLEYLKYKGITASKFGVNIGASVNYIANMRKGVGADKIEIINEKYPDLDIKWLLTGDGTMLRKTSENINSNIVSEPKLLYPNINEDLMKQIQELKEENIKLKGELAVRDETIKGLHNELPIRIEMIIFLQKDKK